MLKFQSQNKSKLGKIAHFSTDHSTCFKVCKYCYNHKSIRMYKATKANYESNTRALNNGESLPNVPKNRDVVRMYMNGDFDSIETINEWKRLATENPETKFFGYTKQWQNSHLILALLELSKMDNVVLRASVDSETDKTIFDVQKAGFSIAGIFEGNKSLSRVNAKNYYVCKFAENKRTCDKCKICFSKKLSHYAIFFPAH